MNDDFDTGEGILQASRGHQQVGSTQTLWKILSTATVSRSKVAHTLFILLGLLTIGRPLHAEDLACMACHSAPSFRQVMVNGKKRSLHVDHKTLASSSHSGISCLGCHLDFRGQKLPHKDKAEPVQCVRCHHNGNNVGAPDATHVELYADSVHGSALRAGDPDAPACKTCHGTHGIRHIYDIKSSVYRTNIPTTCGKCHFDPGFAKRHKIANVEKYRDSVHARMDTQLSGVETAAVCTDCHGIHDIRSQHQHNCRFRTPGTCGKCHSYVLKQYEESIHGKAAARGVKSAPVCTDCHGEHLIDKPSSPDSLVYPGHIATTCSKCHENAKIQRRFDLPANRLSSYISSYHGVANKYRDITGANCATCHGAHNVLPSKDQRSMVNKKNLPKTCGKCHPGAGKNFADGSVHLSPTPKHDPAVFWVRKFYFLFVTGLIGSFCGYIALDLRARWIGRLPWRRGDHRR